MPLQHYFVFLQAMRQLIFVLLLLASDVLAGNKIYSPMVKTLTTIVNNDWQNRPVMELGSRDVLRIGFDELSHDSHRYICHLTRCEADWSEATDVFESDWLQGFNDYPLEDYQNSLNTTVSYTHYEFQIPNEQCRIRMSGNYRLTVFDEDNGHEKVLDAEFYVVEPVVNIGLSMSTNTDIDVNKSHQQLTMTLEYKDLKVVRPEEEIYTVVMQNWNEQTARLNLRPQYSYYQGLRWEHQRELIFDGGNEFHKFEILDVSHPTMGIDHIHWNGEAYEVYPFIDEPRPNYLYDEDANGAFFIRNSDNWEIETTCEYVWVVYRMKCPPLLDGHMIIDGWWTTDADPKTYEMTYDAHEGMYTAKVLQKQGYYSYQYLWQQPDGSTRFAPSEGSFYQTENRYQVLVYYRGINDNYWRLTAFRRYSSGSM